MRLIDANYLRKMLMLETNFTFCGNAETDFKKALHAVEECPTIAADPVRHGNWVFHTFEEVMNGDWLVLSDWQGNGFECSNCGRLIAENKMAYKYKYCPNCGTKMGGDR